MDEVREYGVACLDLSKQLKEAGYKQEGIFWWVNIGKKYVLRYIETEFDTSINDCIAAPTTGELLCSFSYKSVKQQEVSLKYVGGATSLWYAKCYPIDWCPGKSPQEALAECWLLKEREEKRPSLKTI